MTREFLKQAFLYTEGTADRIIWLDEESGRRELQAFAEREQMKKDIAIANHAIQFFRDSRFS